MMTADIVCVTGMHLSGTSVYANILEALGYELGPLEHLMPPAADNPSGFWEHRDLSEINTEILSRAGGSWKSVPALQPGWERGPHLADLRDRAEKVIERDFGEARRWAWKDPRTCLTLPFWRDLLPHMRYVLVLRNPLDVAASMARRGPDAPTTSEIFQLWSTYVAASLRHTSGASRLLVSYEDLRSDTQSQLARLASFVNGAERTTDPISLADRLPGAAPSTGEITEVLDKVGTGLATLQRTVSDQVAAVNELRDRVSDITTSQRDEAARGRERLLLGVRSAVDRTVPRGARLLVAGEGDEDFLRLRGRPASHFPQGPGGVSTGAPPASTKDAIDHLETLRRRGAQYLVLPPATLSWLDRHPGFRRHLEDTCRLLHDDDRCAIYDLRARRRKRPRAPSLFRSRNRARRRARKPAAGKTGYETLRTRVRETIANTVPEAAGVIVVSKGDDELLRLNGRKALHFPQTEDGTYAGHYPADGPAAVAHLEELRSKGGDFFVIPETASWWLDHYPDLRRRLEDGPGALTSLDDGCLIYDLRGGSAQAGTPSVPARAQKPSVRTDPARHARITRAVDDLLPADASFVLIGDHPGPTDFGRRRCRTLGDGDLTAAEAVTTLERYRTEGAEFLIAPAPSTWWERRPGFRRHVERRYPVIHSDRDGAVYELGRTRQRPGSLKVSVLSWDMGHNPLGRAHVLADVLRDTHDVEIIGPHFDRYGTEIWAPLRDSAVPMRTFRGSLLPEQFRTMEEVAGRIDGDVLYVSKPRLPSYGLGMLAKACSNRPLLLDCDELESSFFGAERPTPTDLPSRASEPEFYNPFGEIWTSGCESLVRAADHVTVSNQVLADLYGGTVIPHARDERVFDPSLYDRDAVRARFGLQPDERMLLFAGTPRRHKGLRQISEALERLGNRRYKLCVIATNELREVRSDLGPLSSWIHEIPVQPFDELPALLAAADLTCVLQDPSSGISRYQIPAKITDAIAMGVPCIATRVPPLEPLIEQKAVQPLDDAPLHELIDATLADPEQARSTALERRGIFLDEYSYASVRPKLDDVIQRLASEVPALSSELDELISYQRSVFATSGEARRHNSPRTPRRTPRRIPSTGNVRPPTRATPGDSYDIVVFWKHNDTGIYGRRQDMLVKYLARSDRVNKIIHFDAPVDLRWLRRHLWPSDRQANQSRLLARQTLSRLGRPRRDGKVHHHTFLHSSDSGGWPSRFLPARDAYIQWIGSVLAKHGFGDRTSVFWAYPRLYGFPEITDALAPDIVVSDVVDDDRTWLTPGTALDAELTRNYEEILKRSDIVLASTESVREAMRGFAEDIHLIPNACEGPDLASPTKRVPHELRRLRGPVIGYVGNLSSRIDIPLLEHMVSSRPDWNLVLIGSAHLDRAVLRLQAHPNVHILGPKPYEEAKRYIRAFDVAIIPHVDDVMTRSMHPLKAFVYAAQNVPIVSTDIANIDELRPFVNVAAGPSDFLWRIELALAAGKQETMPPELATVLERNSWAGRVATVLDLLDAHVASREREPAFVR